jgi:predicted nucleotidyltransferase
MLDYIGIFRELNERGIKYIVVGGVAVNLYGIPRMTYDIDLLIDLSEENLINLVNLLKEWGFNPRLPVDINDFIKKEKREEWIKSKNIKAFTFVNSEWAISEIDIVIDSPVDYETAIKRVKHIKISGIPVPIISIDDLIKMKEVSGREQDKSDIRYLKRIKDG